jgi:hypothetical protein
MTRIIEARHVADFAPEFLREKLEVVTSRS